ncbi:MAG: hypothetical protein ACRDDX_15185 [Cellulosilyticaceae bacterium]
MKTVMITEGIKVDYKASYSIDLEEIPFKPCCGCWSCWLKTPGRCIYKELDTFYHEYITADQAIYFVKVKKGFVSSRLKALFDRMSPLYLPYVSVKTDECMHVPRYDHYPDVKFYYEGEFETDNEKEIFEAYIQRTFYQFYSKVIVVEQIQEAALKRRDAK